MPAPLAPPRLLRLVAGVDAANVVGLAVVSPRHGAAAAAGYAPALTGTVLAHLRPHRRWLPRALCILGLVPNTVGSVLAAGPDRRSRMLSLYVGIGGAVLGLGYLLALRERAASEPANKFASSAQALDVLAKPGRR